MGERFLIGTALAVCLSLTPALAASEWQNAVKVLQGEAKAAKDCLNAVNAGGSDKQKSSALEVYTEAKAAADAVTGDLMRALDGNTEITLVGIESQAQTMFAARAQLCEIAEQVAAEDDKRDGEKGSYNSAGETLKDYLEALAALFGRKDASDLDRATTKTQVRAAEWSKP